MGIRLFFWRDGLCRQFSSGWPRSREPWQQIDLVFLFEAGAKEGCSKRWLSVIGRLCAVPVRAWVKFSVDASPRKSSVGPRISKHLAPFCVSRNFFKNGAGDLDQCVMKSVCVNAGVGSKLEVSSFGVAKRQMESLFSSLGTSGLPKVRVLSIKKSPIPSYWALNFYLEKALFTEGPLLELSDDEER